MGHRTSSQIGARRDRRHTVAVPVDVVALRSGVPASIPGRTVNVSLGGLATVLAGEVSAGELVGVQFQLPAAHEPIQAKAVVRHYSLMQCGLQFLAMPAEQEIALRTWTQRADSRAEIIPANVVRAVTQQSSVAKPRQPRLRAAHGLRWVAMTVGLTIVILAMVAWWSWNNGWRDLELGADAGRSTSVPLEVSSSLMGQRIIHRADPIYPSEALRQKIEGEVMLETLIGEDGGVREVHAVSGPDLLRPAAMDAVKWWRFEPYEVNGHATQVHTLIEVDFRLNR
ncbi:MAG TPA: TonB family protein [Terriglobales bacterium]|nr:TonB family protein [Terriglobales bacterium]